MTSDVVETRRDIQPGQNLRASHSALRANEQLTWAETSFCQVLPRLLPPHDVTANRDQTRSEPQATRTGALVG